MKQNIELKEPVRNHQYEIQDLILVSTNYIVLESSYLLLQIAKSKRNQYVYEGQMGSAWNTWAGAHDALYPHRDLPLTGLLSVLVRDNVCVQDSSNRKLT